MNKIILGDNQAIFRAGIAKVLASEEDFRVAAQCSDMARMILAVDTYRSSIVVFASALKPDMTDFMNRIKTAGSRAVVIAENGESATSYTSQGVRGVVYRNTTGAALVDCVHKVIHGLTCVQRPADSAHNEDEDSVGARVRDRLTPKEMKIVALIVQGCKNKEIAQRLGTTEQVIKNYLRSVYDKTGVSDRLELALFTIHHKILAAAAAEAVNGLQQSPTAGGLQTATTALQMRSA
ncbi:MAG TPA: response regulator transcription factor [Acidobacteriaceae bacterium]|jgi:DNA-binding NarL/FixJ family response regulator